MNTNPQTSRLPSETRKYVFLRLGFIRKTSVFIVIIHILQATTVMNIYSNLQFGTVHQL